MSVVLRQAPGEALVIEFPEIKRLSPHPANSRLHSELQLEKIAASMREFGWTRPVVVDDQYTILAGHGAIAAAKRIYASGGEILGVPPGAAPVVIKFGLTDTQKRALVIADNRLAEESEWDQDALASELAALADMDFDLSITGFDSSDIGSIIDAANSAVENGLTDPDEVPEVEKCDPVSFPGDIWILGDHRVMCGDSTNAEDIARLMAGEKAALLHADPPYGMGKEGDGVANDNLYREKLDKFQMAWWSAFRPHIENNASVYIWGNAPDLWRLWYEGGLEDSEQFHFCNHLVWDKKNIAGMKSDLLLQYPIATEHCLFFKRGKQFVGNVNTADYYEGWEPIRLYLKNEAEQVGLNQAKLIEICGVQMFSHWFTKSQWSMIPEKHYKALQEHYPDSFTKSYRELRQEYEQIKGGYRNHINGIQGGMRSYFDNAHDVMRDVWAFPRVVGEERHGHATPKPVAMMERVMKSSLPRSGLSVEPFGGSGSTLMGAQRTGRRCFTMEMQPRYVDVIVKRWQDHTGLVAIREGDGAKFTKWPKDY